MEGDGSFNRWVIAQGNYSLEMLPSEGINVDLEDVGSFSVERVLVKSRTVPIPHSNLLSQNAVYCHTRSG